MRGIVRLAGHVLRSNVSELAHPYKLTYIVTNQCQLRCSMCNIWQKSSDRELTYEEIDRFFRISNRFSWINLSGGEITLRSDILDIIGSLRRHCRDLYLLNFPTNGYHTDLVVDTVMRIIHDHRVPRLLVTVSLDGPPEVHDRIRSQPGSWERSVATFAKLRRARTRSFNVFLGMTLQSANATQFNKTFHSVRLRIGDLSADEFHVNVAHRSAHYYGNPLFTGAGNSPMLWKQLDRIMKRRRALSPGPIAFLEKRYLRLAGSFLKTGMTPVPCQALSASLFLAPDGTVYPCSSFSKPLANIREIGYDLSTLWDSDKRTTLRGEIRKGQCPQCWTPCEAYQSILADLFLRPHRHMPRRPHD